MTTAELASVMSPHFNTVCTLGDRSGGPGGEHLGKYIGYAAMKDDIDYLVLTIFLGKLIIEHFF